LAQAFEVELPHVAAIGDMANDLPMFARAGFTVAMGQAPPHVRTAATATAATNEKDGVADAIARFIRPRIAPRPTSQSSSQHDDERFSEASFSRQT
jgi:3-deoxy-D-manno-octulosonate 8-phosphate phosphatase KdsC-like HAD superfamily phosphatase